MSIRILRIYLDFFENYYFVVVATIKKLLLYDCCMIHIVVNKDKLFIILVSNIFLIFFKS